MHLQHSGRIERITTNNASVHQERKMKTMCLEFGGGNSVQSGDWKKSARQSSSYYWLRFENKLSAHNLPHWQSSTKEK